SEGDEGIGGNRGEELRREHLLTVVAADEAGDDVARDRRAGGARAVAGLHGVGDHRLDLNDLAGPGGLGHIHHAAHHRRSSMQAARVTTTFALLDQTLPSLISARATTVCEVASRTRVDTAARPA